MDDVPPHAPSSPPAAIVLALSTILRRVNGLSSCAALIMASATSIYPLRRLSSPPCVPAGPVLVGGGCVDVADGAGLAWVHDDEAICPDCDCCCFPGALPCTRANRRRHHPPAHRPPRPWPGRCAGGRGCGGVWRRRRRIDVHRSAAQAGGAAAGVAGHHRHEYPEPARLA